MDVVVVESPAKAKTIGKYLGDGYVVLASYGHVRDLPAKDGSVRPDEDFAMTYETDARSVGRLKDIANAVRKADHLYLATDPDREGEAISWHVLAALTDMKALHSIPVKRVVFHEITKDSVKHAIANPRDLDMNLVNAQQARRALDYLVGFTLSPVLWRKLPGSRSAGRVQSVALRLICERELEIEAFVPREYWSIEADFRTQNGESFSAKLASIDGTKLDKFALGTEESATAAVAKAMAAGGYAVREVEKKETRRNPPPPFTTSTLQQEASRKLRFAARRTMDIAQHLYEGVDIGGETAGLITYMRTDGVQIANEALANVRRTISTEYGDSYVPSQPRAYKATAKNAQEAHEAIRPTDSARTPERMQRYLNDDEFRLYELVWKRALASQMETARLEQAAINIAPNGGAVEFRATGQIVLFDGFLRLYRESRDETAVADSASAEREDERRLPMVRQGDKVDRDEVRPAQHFTEPPPRFTEASLVKRLEELGIGRPSTYASILSTLQDRNYVRFDKSRFHPEDRGRLVTAFLENFFKRYVEYDFTARLEEQLDNISAGEIDWKVVLREFWDSFIKAVNDTKELRVREVLDVLDQTLGPYFFKTDSTGADPRVCPTCGKGRLAIKLGKFGAFIGCSNYPECKYTRALEAGGEADPGPRVIGEDPTTKLPMTVKKGPYGYYVQIGEPEGDTKPKRVSIPRNMSLTDLTLDQALGLLALPREVGEHPETHEMIKAGIGRFGPYLFHNKIYASLQADDDVLTVGLNHAVSLLADAAQKRGRGRGGAAALKELGNHPTDGKPVTLHSGRYGPYVKHGKTNATLPKGTEPDSVTLEQALPLLAARAGAPSKSGRGRGRKAAPAPTDDTPKAHTKAKAAGAKKAPAKKRAAKKAAPAAD
ncbi:MAG: type I DNA topoisomerase [Alphaproteobacteria bacterium]|nr:type I DNA topoisomerase [Alphaproteobacteria bacterium]